jgi:acetolactate synthase-1/2/3 large subunit
MEALPDFVKLAESFGGVGMRVTKPGDLDDAITEMIETDNSVIMDVAVTPEENCFPMIPSGAAHNEMIFGAEVDTENAVSEDGMVLV